MNTYIRYEGAGEADGPSLILLDQRLLPGQERFLVCRSWEEAHAAIRDMAVRGAPAIGVAGAFACALAARSLARDQDWRHKLMQALGTIAAARPTAVNLAWAVERMRRALNGAADGKDAATRLEQAALALQRQDAAVCEAIGQSGAPLIADGDTVLTHCNAGALATAGSGTALAVIRAARRAGRKISVIADETRPLLQGSRLTAWELAREGIPVRVACDNACALLMSRGLVNVALTGADRIAANGDAANKIGTLGVAILARHFGLPFYIAAPLSTIDPACPDGSAIAIEERAPEEVTRLCGQLLAPEGVAAFNFAFDVTPAALVSGIITEAGVLRPPYGPAIASALAGAA